MQRFDLKETQGSQTLIFDEAHRVLEELEKGSFEYQVFKISEMIADDPKDEFE